MLLQYILVIYYRIRYLFLCFESHVNFTSKIDYLLVILYFIVILFFFFLFFLRVTWKFNSHEYSIHINLIAESKVNIFFIVSQYQNFAGVPNDIS